METQRICNALLRTRPSPLLPFLAPSAACGTIPSSLLFRQSKTSHRCLATNTPLRATSSATAEQTEPPNNDSNDSNAEKPSNKSSNSEVSETARSESASPTREKSISDILDRLNFSRPRPVTGNAPYNRPQALNQNRRSIYDPENAPSSTDLLRASMTMDSRSRNPNTRRQADLLSSSTMGGMRFVGDPTPQGVAQVAMEDTKLHELRPPVRLDAFVGRSEIVDPKRGMDLGRSLKKLDMKCAYNNVKGDHIKQRFHERGGLKRKRLASERWRKRFNEGFRAVIRKVEKMRKQGW